MDAARLNEKDAHFLWVMAAAMQAGTDCLDDESELKPHFMAWSASMREAARQRLLEARGPDLIRRLVVSAGAAELN